MPTDGGLRPIFHQRLRRGVHWQAVETGGTGLGIPDSNFCADGVEGWVEFKKTDIWAVGLRTEQVGWHLSRWRVGGWTLIATRRVHSGGPRKGEPEDQLWLHEGRHARELFTGGLQAASPLGVWDGGPSQWDWEAIRSTLLRV